MTATSTIASRSTKIRGPAPVVRVGRSSIRIRPRVLTCTLVLTVLVLALGITALTIGDFPLSPAGVLRSLAGSGAPADRFIVVSLRLPRVSTAILAGAALGVAGALFQTVTGNPLGSPDIVGFTTGSATGALVSILLFGGTANQVATAAVLGGLVTAGLVIGLGGRHGPSGYRLVLIGIGIAALLMAVNSFLLTRANLVDARSAALWLTGSLNGRDWTQVRPLALTTLLLIPAALLLRPALATLELGDDCAQPLGVHPSRVRVIAMLVGVGLTAAAIAACGPIAFIALTAPQLARRISRSPAVALTASGLMGAALLLASDIAAQRLFAPTRVPVGVITGGLGGTYLAWLLARGWRKGW